MARGGGGGNIGLGFGELAGGLAVFMFGFGLAIVFGLAWTFVVVPETKADPEL